jgi:hypothetical protein
MLVQVYGDNAMKKTAVYSGWNVIVREEKVSLTKRDQDGQQHITTQKTWICGSTAGRTSNLEVKVLMKMFQFPHSGRRTQACYVFLLWTYSDSYFSPSSSIT